MWSYFHLSCSVYYFLLRFIHFLRSDLISLWPCLIRSIALFFVYFDFLIDLAAKWRKSFWRVHLCNFVRIRGVDVRVAGCLISLKGARFINLIFLRVFLKDFLFSFHFWSLININKEEHAKYEKYLGITLFKKYTN